MTLPSIDYHGRIQRVLDSLNGSALLILAQPQAYRNSTVEAPWRQDSFFYYLTGFSETDSALLLLSHRKVGESRAILFTRDKDPVAELWNGRRLGIQAAKDFLPVDEVFVWEDLWAKLPSLLGGANSVHYSLGHWPDCDRKFVESLRKHRAQNARSVSGLLSIIDPAIVSGKMRIKKSPEEIFRLRAAMEITKNAFFEVKKDLRPGLNERQIHSKLLWNFLNAGAEMEAYGSIVAAGDNACVLHYRENNAYLRDGDLLLIDAGCQVDNYASDVTRTFPINGTFNVAQKALYEVCLAANIDAISHAKPGVTLPEIQDVAFRSLVKGLIDIDLIKGSIDEAIAKNLHKNFCPHSISHWIGLDVHDAGLYSENGQFTKLEAGMYFSVEPGIYIDPGNMTVPEEFRGIGIRIEDDVLITPEGHEVLSAGIPKLVKDIEIT